MKTYLGNELANERDLYQPTLDLAASQATRWLAHNVKPAAGVAPPQNINAFVADAKGLSTLTASKLSRRLLTLFLKSFTDS